MENFFQKKMSSSESGKNSLQASVNQAALKDNVFIALR